MSDNLPLFDTVSFGAAPAVIPTAIKADLSEHYSDWATLALLAFVGPQVSGEHPYVRAISAEIDDKNFALSSIIPDGAKIVRDVKTKSISVALATLENIWVYYAVSDSGIRIAVSGKDVSEVEAIAERIASLVPEPPQPDDSTVPIHVWYKGQSGGTAQRRRLEVPKWEEISPNYPPPVRAQLDELMRLNRPASTGRLILWHGAPGTGKTTAIRALMSAWAEWCEPQYIVDPEIAFASPGYLTDLMTRKFGDSGISHPWLDDDDDEFSSYGGSQAKWRLLIAEDSDEFLRADARQSAGAALGRLLNLSDGILGQGSNTLILLTTNEDMRELHPALIRPGRALAKTEFSKFGVAEANAWLNGTVTVGNPKSLAELYELQGEVKRIGNPPTQQRQIGFGL